MGLCCLRAHFRPYGTPSAQGFVKDITDGYFPYELKERFPSGVPFKVFDRSSDMYSTSKQSFSGAGNTVDNSRKPNLHSLASISGEGGQNKASKEEFLKKLPASVIKNGRVIDIRNSVASTIFKESEKGPEKHSVVVASTDVINQLRSPDVVANKESILEGKGRPITPNTVTTLKVKTSNMATLIVKLRFDDTIATLRKYIDQYTKDNRAYELRTTFPNQVYSDASVSLQDAGLVPNATLHVKPL